MYKYIYEFDKYPTLCEENFPQPKIELNLIFQTQKVMTAAIANVYVPAN